MGEAYETPQKPVASAVIRMRRKDASAKFFVRDILLKIG